MSSSHSHDDFQDSLVSITFVFFVANVLPQPMTEIDDWKNDWIYVKLMTGKLLFFTPEYAYSDPKDQFASTRGTKISGPRWMCQDPP